MSLLRRLCLVAALAPVALSAVGAQASELTLSKWAQFHQPVVQQVAATPAVSNWLDQGMQIASVSSWLVPAQPGVTLASANLGTFVTSSWADRAIAI